MSPTVAIALWAALALLALIRLATAVPGSMAGWGFGVLRFSPPALGWTAWALAAAALLPPLARPLSAALERLGPRGSTGWTAWAVALAFAAALLAWTFPDRLRFVGDFLLRHGTAERALDPGGLYPQALPLDVLLHYHLPRALAGLLGGPVDVAERLMGALEAGALAALAVGFARALGLQGLGAIAGAAIVLGGGYLGVFTGYGKAIAEMVLLTVATGLAALRATRDARWLAALGACLAVGLVLHRSSLALLPAATVAWVVALRAQPGTWRRPTAWLGLALPVATLGFMLPRIVATMLKFDPVHFAYPRDAAGGGPWSALASVPRWLDLANLVTVVSPLALAIPALAAASGRRVLLTPTAAVLAAVALPWAVMTVAIHPPQGMFRDWDNYAAAGASCSMIVAWLAAGALATAPSWRWLALAAALGAVAPSVQWLALHADVDRGLARIEAYLAEPPRRGDAERGRVWDFLGIRNAQLGRWDASAAALARAAETSPSPRVLLQWALAEQARGNSPAAREAFRRVTRLAPDDARAWYGLAAESWNLGDYDECRRAALELERLRPGNRDARALLESLEKVRPHDGP